MLRRPCKPKLIQFDLIAVRLCRLPGVVGSRTRGFVNSRQPSTTCIGLVLTQFMLDSQGSVRVLLSGAPATTWALKWPSNPAKSWSITPRFRIARQKLPQMLCDGHSYNTRTRCVMRPQLRTGLYYGDCLSLKVWP
jgi:hypothetical protein